MTPSPTPSSHKLPTELLLEIFLRCTQLHPAPATLHKLSVVNKEWRTLFKTYETLLWQTATLSAFPRACFSSLSSVSATIKSRTGSEGVCESALNWKETFLVHWGWNARKGRTTVVVPGPPPSAVRSLPLHPSAVSASQDFLDDDDDVDVVPAPAPVVVSIQEALQVQAESSPSSNLSSMAVTLHSHVHQHQHQHQHQHHHHHHHHVHDHHFLMDQQQPLDFPYRTSAAGESPSCSTSTTTANHLYTCTASTSTSNNPFLLPCSSSSSESDDILSCSLCTYSDICLIPQARVCVRTSRTRTGGPLMQVLDWSLRDAIDIGGGVMEEEEDGESESDDDVEVAQDVGGVQVAVVGAGDWHQDLISGMAVNEKGELLVTCSIDGTVRVWDVLVSEFGGQGDPSVKKGKGVVREEGGEGGMGFLEKVERFGCPIRARRLLTGHVGWVNAVAIENTTAVSGGSDHTVRVWDALSGTLLRLIPDLFTSRNLDLGVFTVAIHTSPTSLPASSSNNPHQPSTVLGVGSVIEGYQILDPTTGALLLELDEPLTSRQHSDFETETYQQYASKMAIAANVVVTNSKVAGMLCVWCRWTGELLYRIRVCGGSGSEGGRGRGKGMVPMVSCGLSESSRSARRMQGAEQVEEEEEETIHTFKVNKSGSMLMCTLCDGRVALFEFGSYGSRGDMVLVENSVHSGIGCREIGGAVVDDGSDDAHADAEAHGPGIDRLDSSGGEGVVVEQQSQPQEEQEAEAAGGVEVEEVESDDACGALAWIWARDRQGEQQRVILV